MPRSKTQLVSEQGKIVSGGKNGDGYEKNPVIQEAFIVRNTFEKERKIPQEYKDIKSQIRSKIEDLAYVFVPKLYFALTRNGIDKYTARKIVTADGLQMGWKINTIRVNLPTESKNQNKAKGGKAAAKSRMEKKAKIHHARIDNGNGQAEPQVTLEKIAFVITREDVEEINDKSEKSTKQGGTGEVKIQIEEKDGHWQVRNISAFS